MKTTMTNTHGRLPYRALDVMTLPGNAPGQGLRVGEEAEIHALDLRRNGSELVALVRVPYSTGQTRCWAEVDLGPEPRILSCTPA